RPSLHRVLHLRRVRYRQGYLRTEANDQAGTTMSGGADMPPEDMVSQASDAAIPHSPIPEDWLSEPVDVHRVEEDLASESTSDSWLKQWRMLIRRMEPSDELWDYFHFEEGPQGEAYDYRSGYAVIQNGLIVDHIGEPFSADNRGGVTSLLRTHFFRQTGQFSRAFTAFDVCGASPNQQVLRTFLAPPRLVSSAFLLTSLSPKPLIFGLFPHDRLPLPWDQTAPRTSLGGCLLVDSGLNSHGSLPRTRSPVPAPRSPSPPSLRDLSCLLPRGDTRRRNRPAVSASCRVRSSDRPR